MFRAQAPINRSFKTSTAATGTCVIVVGQSTHLLIRDVPAESVTSSHLLIRAGTALIRRCDD